MNYDRRTYLALLAGAAGTAGVSGCLGSGESTPTERVEPTAGGPNAATEGPRGDTPTVTPPPPTGPRPTRESAPADETGTDGRARGSGTDARSPGPTPPTGTIRLERIDGEPSVPLTVYSNRLEEILRRAASTDGVVRATATTDPDNPIPVLPDYDAVELVDQSGEVSGVYEVDAEGGARYVRRAYAEPTEGTAGDAVPVAELSPERRDFVESAIAGDQPGVYPETPLGTWARREAFGSHFSVDGTTSLLTEIHTTDGAFFSNTVWYVLSLTPSDAADPVTLHLRDIDPDVRSALDPLVSWPYRRAPESVAEGFDPMPDALAAFAAETDGILTHTTALTIAVEASRAGR